MDPSFPLIDSPAGQMEDKKIKDIVNTNISSSLAKSRCAIRLYYLSTDFGIFIKKYKSDEGVIEREGEGR